MESTQNTQETLESTLQAEIFFFKISLSALLGAKDT
jgi:hypothetical protein